MKLIETKLHKNPVKQLTTGENQSTRDEVIASWDEVLTLRPEDPVKDVRGFRNPQLGSIFSALSHWTYSDNVATIVMPTGTGKTEVMLSLLVLAKCERVLVVVPTDALRDQISDKFVELGLLKSGLHVLAETALNPVVGILKTKLIASEEANEFIDKCNVIVATASIMSRLPDDILELFVSKFSHLFIDEAHHAEASTWFRIREKFKSKKILQFTATPFRNDGKRSKQEIIYSYPLRLAHEEGYFKKIRFEPVYEYEPTQVDKLIAEKATAVLREDKKTFPHILLARVQTKKRADEVFEIYNSYKEFRVAKIYSGITGKETLKKSIKNKEFDIVVCVDMLGEGFDLPELKIAAFHDVKKSLPTTIQFVGRFTRSKYDERLGTATVIANLADLNVKNELDELYAQDIDWNEILPRISESKTQKEKDFQELLQGFNTIDEFFVSLHNLKPAISTVIYKNHTRNWNTDDFVSVLSEDNEIAKFAFNDEKKIAVAVVAEKLYPKWTDSLDVYDLSWTLFLIHWNQEHNLLFIHSSNNDSVHSEIAELLVGEKARIINGEDGGQIFRCLDGLKMFTLKNIGLIQLLGKLIRFQMSVGTDIERALTKTDISRAKKSHVFGVGFENGKQVTLGCAYKGRVWTQLQDDIDSFIKWCANVGRKVLDDDIDAEQVLRGAIVPRSLSERPPIFPVGIDWNSGMYKEPENRFTFKTAANEYEFFNSELVLVDPSDTGSIKFALESNDEQIAQFELELFTTPDDYNDFVIKKTSPDDDFFICFGKREERVEQYFYRNTPEIWFADGSVLEGVSYAELKEEIEPYDVEKINTWDWNGVDLSVEAQQIRPKLTNSIQYRCIENLSKAGYEIIYDDDYSGEIADVIAIKESDDTITVELFHLKYAKGGTVSSRIDNLYELCGQVQKSVRWKFKDSREFFSHLLRRKTKSKNGQQCSRIEKGTEADLQRLLGKAKRKVPMDFKVYAVQPGLSKTKITPEQLTLLAVTEAYLNAKGVEFEVIGNEL